MSAAQQQALLLGIICLSSALVLAVVLALTRVNRFGVFAVVNCLIAALLFVAQVVFGFSGWRSEIFAASVSELPVVLLISWVCLAQAGGLTSGPGSLPSEPVVRHPRLRKVLGRAPIILLGTWVLATLFGFIWPAPAMQAYVEAPLQFLLFKWPISVSQMVYAGLAAVVFTMVAASSGGATILRLRNVAFSLSLFALALIAAESTIFAGVRFWAQGRLRRGIIDVLLNFEAVAAFLCLTMLVLGLTLRYTPAIAAAVVRKAHTGWLPARERLEALGWHAVAGGRTRGVARVTYRVGEAAKLAGLSPADREKAIATMQLLVVMQDSSTEMGSTTPDAARELYEIEEDISQDEVVAKIHASLGDRWRSSSSRSLYNAPLRDPLKAALDLTDAKKEQMDASARSLWFYLVAVASADTGLIDGNDVLKRFGSPVEYFKATEAYRAAKSRLRAQAFRKPS